MNDLNLHSDILKYPNVRVPLHWPLTLLSCPWGHLAFLLVLTPCQYSVSLHPSPRPPGIAEQRYDPLPQAWSTSPVTKETIYCHQNKHWDSSDLINSSGSLSLYLSYIITLGTRKWILFSPQDQSSQHSLHQLGKTQIRDLILSLRSSLHHKTLHHWFGKQTGIWSSPWDQCHHTTHHIPALGSLSHNNPLHHHPGNTEQRYDSLLEVTQYITQYIITLGTYGGDPIPSFFTRFII